MIKRHLTLLPVLLLLATAAVPVTAQERDTGRRKPVVKEPETLVEDVGELPRKALPRRWHMGITFGLQGASDLFRVETADGNTIPGGWSSLGSSGFDASRFTATFDQDLSMGLFLQRDVGDMVALRADVAFARMDVPAEALTGQVGMLYLYDRMDLLNIGVGAEFRLTRAPSHPFAGVAFLVSRLSPTTFDDLAQTNLGGRLSLGYLQKLTPQVGVRLEGRLGVTSLDVDEFRPPARLVADPEIDYDPETSLRIFEILVGVQATFGE